MAQGYKETATKLKEAQGQLQTAEGNIRNLTNESDKMKEAIGYPVDMKTDELLTELDGVLKNVSGDQTEVPKNCRAVIEKMFQDVIAKNEELKSAKAERDSYQLKSEEEEAKTRNQKE